MTVRTVQAAMQVTKIHQKGPWNGRLVSRVLPPQVHADYDHKKPALCRIDPSELCKGTGPNNFRPFTTPLKSTHTPRNLDDKTVLYSGWKKIVNPPNDHEQTWIAIDVYMFHSENNQVIHVHMNRDSTEEIGKTLKRLEISISRKLPPSMQLVGEAEVAPKKKKKKKQRNNLQSSSSVWMKGRDSTAEDFPPADLIGVQATKVWKDSSAVSLSFGGDLNVDLPLQVENCPPTILAVNAFENFESRIFVGIPLVVEVDLVYADHAVMDWYVDWKLVCSNSSTYTPKVDDVGKQIAVMITPVRSDHFGEGCEEAYAFKNLVEPRPDMPIIKPLREEWAVERLDTGSSLRVLSYNILADQNAYSHDVGTVPNIYPWCDLRFLERSRRMPLIAYEILAYQPDVICLQEVDLMSFDSLLRPVLNANGYQGFYSVKVVDSSREGCAMFWSLRCFEKIPEDEMLTFAIKDLFPSDDMVEDDHTWQSLKDLNSLLDKHPHLRKVVQSTLGHVLQTVTLTLRQNSASNDDDSISRPEKIVLSNTHLFFHPHAGHIRVMQLLVCCYKMEMHRRMNGQKYPFVFCGDFNSAAPSGGVRLLFRRSVPPDHGRTWRHLHSFEWQKGDDAPPGTLSSTDIGEDDSPANYKESLQQEPPTLALPDSFPSLCSGYGVLPEFTHYIRGFVGTLDYILASEPSETEPFGFGPRQWAAMPSEKELKQYTALPNEFMPSDHLSLVCDLEYRRHEA